ncbi:MAG: uroporphyrinogen decarboxylase [Gammaproteobacteria bacterium]
MNHRFLKVLNQEPVDRPPVWLMRQAGRYLPEYRALRAQVPDFMQFCKTPELAMQATLQPLQRFPLDAAIIFSDILTIPDALGLKVHFVNGEGPVLENPIQSKKQIQVLKTLEPYEDLAYVMQAIQLTKAELGSKTPLIGFSGSPWTLATYMLEGGSSKSFSKIKSFLYQEPESLSLLLQHLAEAIAAYLKAQVQAGADALMLFDTWGGILNKSQYLQYSLKFMQKILEVVRLDYPKIPVIFFTKNAGLYLKEILNAGPNAVGIDYMANIHELALDNPKAILQGNLDPSILLTNPALVKNQVQYLLENYPHPGQHIVNLGHGILPESKLECVYELLETVSNYESCFSRHL